MEEHQLNVCNNCEANISETDKFCASCGQKNTTGKVSVKLLLQEFFANHLHLDAKLPRTLFVLFFKPGRLTTNYFKGKHIHFIRPLRLFAVSAIIFFTLIALDITKQLEHFNLYQQKHDEILELEMTDSLYQQVLDSVASVKTQTNKRIYPILDSAFAPMVINIDSLLNDTINYVYLDIGPMKSEQIPITREDFFTLSEDQIIEKYKPKNFWSTFVLKQNLRIIKNTKGFTRQAIGNISWMIFLMIPTFALLLKLFYIRRKIYYVEHLIFAFHTHAFLFLLFGINAFSDYFLSKEVDDIINLISVIASWIYLFIAMKHVYGQRSLKTFIKMFLLFIGYLFLFMGFLTLTLLVSLALF